MTLTAPIPDAARPIVEAIRAEVPRPEPRYFRLIQYGHGYAARQFLRSTDGHEVCPMGMLPNAIEDTPEGQDGFRECKFTDNEIEAFFSWWDDKINAEAAVLAVWGEEA